MFGPPGRKVGGGCRERYLLYKFDGNRNKPRYDCLNGETIFNCWLFQRLDNSARAKHARKRAQYNSSFSATKLKKREDQKQQKQMRYSIVPVPLSKRHEMVCHMAES